MARIAIIALLLLATVPALAEPAQPDAPPPPPRRRRMPVRRRHPQAAAPAEQNAAAPPAATLRHRTRICANPCA